MAFNLYDDYRRPTETVVPTEQRGMHIRLISLVLSEPSIRYNYKTNALFPLALSATRFVTTCRRGVRVVLRLSAVGQVL